ncbi:PIN domain-containing protein [Saccharopolyspora sp. 5N708]|uniref:PIN domain-containing protein n=1 Tax=Saccharopolyspora sp. 5N708 TaxID=3457424 RepID=UPI003FD1CD97
MAFPALLDTCVLFPQYLTDTLLRLAAAQTFRPLRSADILAELRRTVAARVGEQAIDYRINQMRQSFRDAEVVGYEALIPTMDNDETDRHVLAAAIRGGAEVIVTYNVKDFPDEVVRKYDVAAVHPDDFLLDQLDLFPGCTLDCLHRQVGGYRRPPQTVPELMAIFGTRCGLPRFADEVRRHLR